VRIEQNTKGRKKRTRQENHKEGLSKRQELKTNVSTEPENLPFVEPHKKHILPQELREILGCSGIPKM